MLKLWKSPVSVEDLFLAYYDRLIGWALQIAHGDQELAEDLVHDAYIQFTLARPDINSIQNLDGYLYVMLLVLHRSFLRKAALRQLRHLYNHKFSSAYHGMRTVSCGVMYKILSDLPSVYT